MHLQAMGEWLAAPSNSTYFQSLIPLSPAQQQNVRAFYTKLGEQSANVTRDKIEVENAFDNIQWTID